MTTKIAMIDATITKLLQFTDIHFGARNNSEQHNLDNLEYGDWLIDLIKTEAPSHVAFLGDFFENRNAINVHTLELANEFCMKLNALGIQIFFCIGNHDLYHRSTRKFFSTRIFGNLENFSLISEPTLIGDEWLAMPFLFRDEYAEFAELINSRKYVFGHFEFRDFVVTGATKTLDHGPDATHFAAPKYLFSGHFHKRQVTDNIIFIGNTFPTNFGDAGDIERGACVFDVINDRVDFFNWVDCPSFYKIRLSKLLAGQIGWPAKSRVKCIVDVDIAYSEVQTLRSELLEAFNLREFTVEEDIDAKSIAIAGGEELDNELDDSSIDTVVCQLLEESYTPTPSIDPQVLIDIYKEL